MACYVMRYVLYGYYLIAHCKPNLCWQKSSLDLSQLGIRCGNVEFLVRHIICGRCRYSQIVFY